VYIPVQTLDIVHKKWEEFRILGDLFLSFHFSEHHDSIYEIYCVVFDMGLWYTKHAAKIAAATET
jgi:hypothetical protein